MFPREIYLARRDRLMSQFDGGLLLFLGNGDSPMNYADNPYHFKQDSSFLYYFGLDQPGLAGVIDADSGETFAVTNPATGDVVAEVARCGGDETRRAIEAAEVAQVEWREKTASERSVLMRRWFDLMMDHQEHLAQILTAEQAVEYGLIDAVIDGYYPLLEGLGEYLQEMEDAVVVTKNDAGKVGPTRATTSPGLMTNDTSLSTGSLKPG